MEIGNNNMPRKTLALILGLVLVTVVLFVIALRTNNPQPGKDDIAAPSAAPVEPTPAARSVLTLSPNPVTVRPGQKGSVDVVIDTADHEVTGVQLEIAYDPNIISNVKAVPGPLFQKTPTVLYDKFDNNDPKSGRYTFAPVLQPNQEPIRGTGVVATVTFTARGALGTQTQLALLGPDPSIAEKPGTLVTARGAENSVLRMTDQVGALVVISNDATSSPASRGQSDPQAPASQ